ncbi:SixA phosphatase family protein [Streptomyces gamaensis]|uniref:SixA phosphatase family protein n=1 Tax=Streptomyces gamaensis TaxID=1763542 RepID=A0ABW0YZT8_9ACTN
MTVRPCRRLFVLRHAKSAWPPDVADHERPLAPRGRRDAPAAGRWLRAADCLPERVLCSTSLRTRQTWALAAPELGGAVPPVAYEPRLYRATLPELFDVLREVPDDVGALLCVGHNPGLQELVLALAGEDLAGARGQVEEKFPSAAIAVLTWHGPWRDLAPGAALLTDVAVPRGGKA